MAPKRFSWFMCSIAVVEEKVTKRVFEIDFLYLFR